MGIIYNIDFYEVKTTALRNIPITLVIISMQHCMTMITHSCTDEASAYKGITGKHLAVKHFIGHYVVERAHTNGNESFWSMLKRGYHGTYQKMSRKHLQRYITEFQGRHNSRPMDTVDQMTHVANGGVGKQLRYKDLIKTDSNYF